MSVDGLKDGQLEEFVETEHLPFTVKKDKKVSSINREKIGMMNLFICQK